MAGNRILYFYLLVLSFLFFVLFDLYLFHLFFLFLLLLPPASLLAALPASRALRCRMEIDDDIVPKGNCSVCLIAENTGILPCACVRVRFLRRNALGRMPGRNTESSEDALHFALLPKQRLLLHPAVRVAHCGRVDLTVTRVEVCDMLGLIAIPVPLRYIHNATASVYVLPELQIRTVETEEAADLGLDSATYSTEKPGGDPSEIFQLRDYRPGDSRHSIHWKLSSRMDRLIVREFGLPLNASLHFLLELREDATPAAAEHLLGAMLAFSECLMSREIVHCISWLDEDGVLQTVSVTGAESLAAALHELLALPGQTRWSALTHFAAQESKRSETHLMYLVAGTAWKPDDGAEVERLLENLVPLGICRRFTLMPDRCTREATERLHTLGCEVQLLNARVPGAESEADG